MTQIQKTILKEDINTLLETIREQFESLDTFEGKIPILEFEIIKDNIRKVYDKLFLLQRMNDQQEGIIREKSVPVQSTPPEPPKQEIPVTETPVYKEKEQEQPPEIKPEKENPDLFSVSSSAFAEKLKEAREQTVGPRSNQPRPGDIKSIININDKFLFINELFDGDYKEYTRVIDTFNTFGEKGEAFEYLDSLLKENLWNSTSTAFMKLKEIVEKRFV